MRARVRGQPAPGVVRIEREPLVDLGDDRHRAEREHGARGGDPRVGRDDDLVSGPDPQRGEPAYECARSRIDRKGVRHVQVLRERPLQLASFGCLERIARGAVVPEQLLRPYDLAHGFGCRVFFGLVHPQGAGEHRWHRALYEWGTHEPSQAAPGDLEDLAYRTLVEHSHAAASTRGRFPGGARHDQSPHARTATQHSVAGP